MSTYIAGFICALVLAALVIVWIAYCMFCKERHQSEFYHSDITDILQRNIEISQQHQIEESTLEKRNGFAAGIFILPSWDKENDDDYEQRPDYPEGPIHNLQPGEDNLVDMFNTLMESTEQSNAGFEISAFCDV